MTERMNIVLLMSDQWRWDTLFQEGHICQTPNLDRLGREGVVFRNAFTSYPLCSPARSSLFTGKWPHQTGVVDNVSTKMYFEHGKMNLEQVTYLERLRDAGYAVAYCGKWHLGIGTLPDRGIENSYLSDGAPEGSRRGDTAQPAMDPNYPRLDPYYATFTEGTGVDQQAIERGIDQIERFARGDAPFCVVISTWGPHFAHNTPAGYAEKYADLPDDFMPDNYVEPFTENNKPLMQSRPYWPCQNTRPLTREDWKLTCQHYWGFCTHLDEQYGRVMARLETLGLAENTLVAFCADHGEMLGAHGGFDKGPYFYEEIMRIPMIVRDPKRRAPADPDGFVNLRDLFPTLISLAGADEVLRRGEDARSYFVTRNGCTFYCYDMYQGRQFILRGIRTDRWKYNWSPHDMEELYDLENDPQERINLADLAEYAEVQKALHAELMAWMESEGDTMRYARHLPPMGSYIDGRGFDEQHDHGWSEAEWAWIKRTTPRE